MNATKTNTEISTQRTEAFSDGVFAIAITLLILEIKVPVKADLLHQTLWHYLEEQWPRYFAYVFTFIMVGIYWSNHHYIFKLYKRTNHIFLLLNVLFLMAISFLPFPTGIFGEYIMDAAHCKTAVTVYNLGLFFPAFIWMLTWLYASKNKRLIDHQLADAFIRRLTTQYIISSSIYLSSVVISFYNTTCSFVINLGLTLSYLLPPKKPEYSTT